MPRRLTLKLFAPALLLILCACELEFAPGGGDNAPQAPLVKSLSLGGEAAANNRAVVVTRPQTLRIVAEAGSSADLASLVIAASRDSATFAPLATCDDSPCRYDWALDATENGVYSFYVEAEDVRGGLSRLPYSSSLVVDIK